MGKSLDVGCGDNKIKGTIGLDIVDLPGVDIVHDLNQYPWPFEEQEFDRVYMDDVLEHLNEPLKAIEEVYRILKPEGKFFLRIIHWSHEFSIADPTHVRYFSEFSFRFLTGEIRSYYHNARFRVERLEVTYDKHAKRLFRSVALMEFLSRYLINIKKGMQAILIKE